MIDVFLAGEGATELGGWARQEPYLIPIPEVGVVEAFLRKLVPVGWTIRGATVWKSIRKYRAGKHDPEVRNVMGAALQAKESGAKVFIFSRDRDGDAERERQVHEGTKKAREELAISVVGGVAIEAIEAWTLSARGDRKVYEHRWPKETFAQLGVPSDHRSQVEIIEKASLAAVDSPSLRKWLDEARAVLQPGSADDAPIFLIGFMATGKTTVGGMLAKKLGWSFVDLDQEISAAAGKTVPEIFSTEGEPGFRRREADAVTVVSGRNRVIVATGGGAACQPASLEQMLSSGRVVWLQVTAEEAIRRTRGGKGRPLLEGQSDLLAKAAALLADREPYYVQAHVPVDTTGRSLQDIVQEIMIWFQSGAGRGRSTS